MDKEKICSWCGEKPEEITSSAHVIEKDGSITKYKMTIQKVV